MDEEFPQQIMELIASFFNRGIVITESVVHYASSALGIDGADRLFELLNTGDVHETGLLELIISPSEQLRSELEPLVPCRGMEHDCINKIAKVLPARFPLLRLLYGHHQEILFRVTEADLRVFISALQLDRAVPCLTGEALHNMEITDLFIIGRLYWRKLDLAAAPKREEFFHVLINRLSEKDGRDADFKTRALGEVLKLYGEDAQDGDTETLLTRKILSLKEQLARKWEFDEIASKYSMDLLMSQRITPPPINQDEIQRTLMHLNYIVNRISE